MLDAVQRLDRAEYNVEEMMSETFLDLDQIVQFLDEARKFEPQHDDKLQKLVRLLKAKDLAGQKVLIFTDGPTEGLHLQDASRMINYDIHWNPVRLMQRIGRVDRRMSPEVEKRLVADHPDVGSSRGKVSF